MIRMGRSSKKSENSDDTGEFQEPAVASNFPFPNDTQTSSTHAISESESMARDIKEGRLSGFVGAGTVLSGETNFDSMLRIDGHLTGKISSDKGTLVIGSTGQVDANINVAAAVINGTVNGDIITTEKLELGRTARVVGNITAPRLMIADGAVLEGSCSMIKSKEKAEQSLAENRKTDTDDFSDYKTFAKADQETEDSESTADREAFKTKEENVEMAAG